MISENTTIKGYIKIRKLSGEKNQPEHKHAISFVTKVGTTGIKNQVDNFGLCKV